MFYAELLHTFRFWIRKQKVSKIHSYIAGHISQVMGEVGELTKTSGQCFVGHPVKLDNFPSIAKLLLTQGKQPGLGSFFTWKLDLFW